MKIINKLRKILFKHIGNIKTATQFRNVTPGLQVFKARLPLPSMLELTVKAILSHGKGFIHRIVPHHSLNNWSQVFADSSFLLVSIDLDRFPLTYCCFCRHTPLICFHLAELDVHGISPHR